VRRYTGPGNDHDDVLEMALDSSGNVYVTGGSKGSGTGLDIVTIKYDTNGVQKWVRRYNGPGNGEDEAFRIGVDGAGNIYVAGFSTSMNSGFDCTTIKY
jgi:hypothetical protein